jgi:RNA polymerase sigma-70 factor (ECF subfamily)
VAFIVVDDDAKENNVSPTAVNMLSKSEFIEPAKSEPVAGPASGYAEIEELGAMFREHYKLIFRVAYRLTGSQSDAEDVLQTIFLRLTPEQARKGLLPNPQGYLYRAAVNASLDL